MRVTIRVITDLDGLDRLDDLNGLGVLVLGDEPTGEGQRHALLPFLVRRLAHGRQQILICIFKEKISGKTQTNQEKPDESGRSDIRKATI